MKKKFLLLFLFCLSLTILSIVPSFAEIPQVPQAFYLDQLGVLSEETKNNITDTNKELDQKTGAQVAVFTTSDLAGNESFTYAVEVFNTWKIGSKDKDNGVLILLSRDPDDPGIDVLVGYGLEETLNDGKVGRILDEYMVYPLRDEGARIADANPDQLDKTTNQVFNAIIADIINHYDVELTGDYSEYQDTIKEESDWTYIVIFVIIIIIIYFKFGRGGGGSNGSGGKYRRTGPFYGPYFPSGGYGGRSSGGGFGGGSFGGGSTGGGGASR